MASRYAKQIEPRFSSLHEDGDLLWVVPFRVRYMLGICGYRYAGKSVAFSYLVERQGFKLYSLSTTLRRLAAERGISAADRPALQDFGDQLRKTNGADHLAKLTLREIRRDQLSHRPDARTPSRIVVGGFKRDEEVEAFRNVEQFKLVAIDVDEPKRFSRAREVGLPADELHQPPETLISDDQIADQIDRRDRLGEGPSDDAYGQAVESVMSLVSAKDRIDNNGSMPALFRALDQRVAELDRRYRRPRG